jgi:hypothetical protein
MVVLACTMWPCYYRGVTQNNLQVLRHERDSDVHNPAEYMRVSLDLG